MVDAVMTGHLYNRILDPAFPATLSRQIVNGLLREQLGYDGVVLSDDMQMRAITSHFGLEETVCRAINAGIDLLIFGNNLDYDPDIAEKAINAIVRGLRDGTIAEETIAAALARVENFKRTLGSDSRLP
jgi:beta-N-acetylhexosaminidase